MSAVDQVPFLETSFLWAHTAASDAGPEPDCGSDKEQTSPPPSAPLFQKSLSGSQSPESQASVQFVMIPLPFLLLQGPCFL